MTALSPTDSFPDIDRIWKFPVSLTEVVKIEAHAWSRWLHAALDPSGQPCLWGVVCEINDPKPYWSVPVATGQPFPHKVGPEQCVGMIQAGPFVVHMFVTPYEVELWRPDHEEEAIG